MRWYSALLAPVLVAAPVLMAVPAQAVTHQLDVVGRVNPSASNYTPTGEVDFLGVGTAEIATGLFSSIVTIDEALAGPGFFPTVFTLFDIQFEDPTPRLVYSGAGFEFWATRYMAFDNDLPDRGFDAVGFVTGPGISNSLRADFSLSTQATSLSETNVSFSSTLTAIPLPAPVLMLISAFGGLGLLGWLRRRSIA